MGGSFSFNLIYCHQESLFVVGDLDRGVGMFGSLIVGLFGLLRGPLSVGGCRHLGVVESPVGLGL